MVNITLIVGFVAVIIVAFILFKFVSGVIKAIFAIAALIVLAIFVFFAFVALDAYDMKQTISSGNSILMVSDGDDILGGTIIGGDALDSEEINSYSAAIEELGEVKDTVVFIADKSVLSVEQGLDEISPDKLIKYYNEGSIEIYPEPVLLKSLKYVPTGILESVYKKIVGGAGK